MISDLDASLDLYIRAALERKAEQLVVLDVRALTTIADGFIICSGRSSRQVTAIGETILTALKKKGIRPLSVVGLKEGHWVLLDYGHIIIHVFYGPVREFYDLESLWIDAETVNIDAYLKKENGIDHHD